MSESSFFLSFFFLNAFSPLIWLNPVLPLSLFFLFPGQRLIEGFPCFFGLILPAIFPSSENPFVFRVMRQAILREAPSFRLAFKTLLQKNYFHA